MAAIAAGGKKINFDKKTVTDKKSGKVSRIIGKGKSRRIVPKSSSSGSGSSGSSSRTVSPVEAKKAEEELKKNVSVMGRIYKDRRGNFRDEKGNFVVVEGGRYRYADLNNAVAGLQNQPLNKVNKVLQNTTGLAKDLANDVLRAKRSVAKDTVDTLKINTKTGKAVATTQNSRKAEQLFNEKILPKIEKGERVTKLYAKAIGMPVIYRDWAVDAAKKVKKDVKKREKEQKLIKNSKGLVSKSGSKNKKAFDKLVGNASDGGGSGVPISNDFGYNLLPNNAVSSQANNILANNILSGKGNKIEATGINRLKNFGKNVGGLFIDLAKGFKNAASVNLLTNSQGFTAAADKAGDLVKKLDLGEDRKVQQYVNNLKGNIRAYKSVIDNAPVFSQSINANNIQKLFNNLRKNKKRIKANNPKIYPVIEKSIKDYDKIIKTANQSAKLENKEANTFMTALGYYVAGGIAFKGLHAGLAKVIGKSAANKVLATASAGYIGQSGYSAYANPSAENDLQFGLDLIGLTGGLAVARRGAKKLSLNFEPSKKNLDEVATSLLDAKKINQQVIKKSGNKKNVAKAKKNIAKIDAEIKYVNTLRKDPKVIKTQGYNPQKFSSKDLSKTQKKIVDLYHVTDASVKDLIGKKKIGEITNPKKLKKEIIDIAKKNKITGVNTKKNEIESNVEDFLKSKKSVIISGSRAQNLYVPKSKIKKPKDYDLLSSNPRKDAIDLQAFLKSKYPKSKITVKKKANAYTVKRGGVDVADFVKKPKGQKSVTIDGRKYVVVETLASSKVKTLSDPKFAKRKEKDLDDIKRLTGGKVKEKDVFDKIRKLSKGEFEVRRMGGMGKDRLKFDEDHFYTDLGASFSYDKKGIPTIVRFAKVKVDAFPQDIRAWHKRAVSGQLSQRQQVNLRMKINRFIKANKNKFFIGPKPSSQVKGEREVVTPVGSKYKQKSTLKTKVSGLFGRTASNKFTYDDELGTFVEIIDLVPPGKAKTSLKTDLKEIVSKFSETYGKDVLKNMKVRFSPTDLREVRKYKKLIGSGKKLTQAQSSGIKAFAKRITNKILKGIKPAKAKKKKTPSSVRPVARKKRTTARKPSSVKRSSRKTPASKAPGRKKTSTNKTRRKPTKRSGPTTKRRVAPRTGTRNKTRATQRTGERTGTRGDGRTRNPKRAPTRPRAPARTRTPARVRTPARTRTPTRTSVRAPTRVRTPARTRVGARSTTKTKTTTKRVVPFDSSDLKNKVAVFEGRFRERKDPRKAYNKKTNPIINKKVRIEDTKNRMLEKLSKRVDKSLVRSMEIEVKKVQNKKKKDIPAPDRMKKFRLKKGKDPAVLKMVEKSKHINDTPGEKRELKITKRKAKSKPKTSPKSKKAQAVKKSAKSKPKAPKIKKKNTRKVINKTIRKKKK